MSTSVMKPAMMMCALIGWAAGTSLGDVYVGSAGPGVVIPDDSVAGVEIPIELGAPAGALIESVTVELVIEHDWVGDLVVVLRAPGGAEVVLLDRVGLPNGGGFPGAFGCGGRGVDARFVDGASVAAEDLCSATAEPVIAGDVRGVEMLGGLAGGEAGGAWVLVVSDRSAHDTGVVVSVSLTVEASAVCPADLNGDTAADFFDISLLLSGAVDYNGDTGFDFFDVSEFLQDLGAGCP